MERGITSMLNVEKIEQTKRKKGMTCGYWIHCENNVMIGLCEKIGQTTHHDYTHTFFQEVGCDWIYDVCTQTNGGSWLAGVYEPRKLSVGSPAKVNSRVSVRFCEVFTMNEQLVQYVKASIETAKGCRDACSLAGQLETAAFWSGHVVAYESLLLMVATSAKCDLERVHNLNEVPTER